MASELGLHFLHISPKHISGLKRVSGRKVYVFWHSLCSKVADPELVKNQTNSIFVLALFNHPGLQIRSNRDNLEIIFNISSVKHKL